MATVTYIRESKQSASAMRGVIAYCIQQKKVYDSASDRRLVSGVNCDGEHALTEFSATKAAYGKTTGMNFYQYVQSFSPAEKISPQEAHEIGKEFAEKAWPGYEILVATHCDAAHLHTHFVVNSVGCFDGKKLRQNPNTLKALRKISDEICKAHGLTTLIPYEEAGAKLSSREYRAAVKGEGWKLRLMKTIDAVMDRSGSREEFIAGMRRRGYDVTWTDERKYITYTCPNEKRCRDNKLHYEKYGKENMEYEFAIRQEIAEQYNFGRAPGSRRRGRGDAGDEGRPERVVGAVSGDALGGEPFHGGEAGGGERQGDAAAEGEPATGWERSREKYFRALRSGQGFYDGDTAEAASADDRGFDLRGGALGAGLRGAVDLASLIDDDSEDPEEKRKRIEAQEHGSNLGAVLGLAAGLAAGLLEDEEAEEDEDEEEEEEEEFGLQL